MDTRVWLLWESIDCMEYNIEQYMTINCLLQFIINLYLLWERYLYTYLPSSPLSQVFCHAPHSTSPWTCVQWHLRHLVTYLFHVHFPRWTPKVRDHVYGHCAITVISLRSHMNKQSLFSSVQCTSFAQLSPTLCNPMDCSTPGLPVHHQLPEFTQTHVHWVSDAIQPSHPWSSPSPPAFNLSQHQGLFKWVSSLHQVARLGVSASTPVLPMNTQDWSAFG